LSTNLKEHIDVTIHHSMHDSDEAVLMD
jgi:hypothetical protein